MKLNHHARRNQNHQNQRHLKSPQPAGVLLVGVFQRLYEEVDVAGEAVEVDIGGQGVFLQFGEDVGLPVDNEHRLYQVVCLRPLGGQQRIDGVGAADLLQRLLEFLDLVVYLPFGGMVADHIGQPVGLHTQAARIVDGRARAFQPPRQQQGEHHRQQSRTDPKQGQQFQPCGQAEAV